MHGSTALYICSSKGQVCAVSTNSHNLFCRFVGFCYDFCLEKAYESAEARGEKRGRGRTISAGVEITLVSFLNPVSVLET